MRKATQLARELALHQVFCELVVMPTWQEAMSWLESWADQDPWDTASSKFNDVTTDYCVSERYSDDTVGQLLNILNGSAEWHQWIIEKHLGGEIK